MEEINVTQILSSVRTIQNNYKFMRGRVLQKNKNIKTAGRTKEKKYKIRKIKDYIDDYSGLEIRCCFNCFLNMGNDNDDFSEVLREFHIWGPLNLMNLWCLDVRQNGKL